jgi:hypothetical protein
VQSSDPLRRLHELIQRSVPHMARPGGGCPAYLEPIVATTPEEAAGFFRAIDAKLFEVEPDGQCRPSPRLRQGYYCYGLLYRPLNAFDDVRMWREFLTHAAAVAILHLDYGYRCDDIALDVDSFDLLVYSRSNQPLVAVEVKKTTAELDKMLAAMHGLAAVGLETVCNRRKLSNAHNKFRGLLAIRPKYFLAIAPGDIRALRVRYRTDQLPKSAELVPVDRIPRGR